MCKCPIHPQKHFNPLPPCGGRPRYDIIILVTVSFQSTPSVWRETDRYRLCRAWQMISIHSLRVEGDRLCKCPIHPQKHFNPLPPCGGRPRYDIIILVTVSFQSTPSVWRETKVSYPGGCQCHISIHSLRVEGDAVRSASCRSDTHFNPLPPCGGRRLPVYVLPVDRRFQSTPSVWRETSQTFRTHTFR